MSPITVHSPDFDEGGPVPTEFTCRGAGRVPALTWTGVPPDTRSLALVVDDPGAPFVHWIALGLAADSTGITDGAPADAVEAANGAGRPEWYPPCPTSPLGRPPPSARAPRRRSPSSPASPSTPSPRAR